MNKYLGKPSQKLCIAGFVVCALAAPLFQLEAVQDFVLNDVGRALVGRPINSFDRWKSELWIFSLLFFAAALVAFSCLYSLATYSPLKARRSAIKRAFSLSRLRGAAKSASLSGYFKGAAQELKDFFHNKDVFNKRNGYILLGIFAITFIGYFALIRNGVAYADDLVRTMYGFFGWLGNRRFVTQGLNLAIHGASLLHDRSPLGQVIAMGFLSVAAFIVALVFSGFSGEREDNRLKWLNVAAAMIVAFNPHFLQCIAWQYDSPGMAASVLFPLIPFLFLDTKRLYSLGSVVCLIGMYVSYQASSGIYIMMVIFVALLKYITSQWTLEKAAGFCARSAASFVVASLFFYLVIARFFGLIEDGSKMGVAVGFNIISNIVLYLILVWRDFNGLWKALCLLVLLAAAFAACKVSKKELLKALPLFGLALALAFVLSQGSYIFLSQHYGAPRTRYCFALLFAILASVSVLSAPSLSVLWKKALAAAPAVLLAWSFFSYASAFGNAHANQTKMELQYEALVRQDINALFSQEEYPRLEIVFVGAMPFSGELKHLVETYPVTAQLRGPMYAELPYFGTAITMEYFDPTLAPVRDGMNLTIGETTLLLSRRYYDILLEESTGRVIVECKMGEES